MGYSAMRALDPMSRAILATGGLTEKDIKPVLVPNVMRSADDFLAGAADMFMFAFGAPKVREVDATSAAPAPWKSTKSPVWPTARKISPYGYLSDIAPGPIFVGVDKPMKAYTIDNILFTHAKVTDDVVYKLIETDGEQQGRPDRGRAGPARVRGRRSAQGLQIPDHPGALKYFKDKRHRGQGVPVR